MDLQARIESVRRRMASDRIDILVAASTGLHTLDRADPVAYLTGYRSVGESIFLLYLSGDATLIVSPAADAERLASRYTTFAALATNDIAGAFEKILGAHPELTIATVNFNLLPYRLAEKLFSLCGAASRSFDDIFYTIAGSKTKAEIDRARTATTIAEKGFDRLLQIARTGLRECDLAVETNAFTKSLGAEDNFLMLNFLPHSHAVMPSSTRPIEPGDILLTELSPNFDGQFSQICRTVSIGSPRPELQGKYDLVVRAMWAGIEAVRPGIPISEVCRAIDRVLESAGYAEYCRPPYMRRRGHGLGSGGISPGDIAVDNHTILEEDMIFVVHPNQYLPEVGYLLCGEPVRVTASGVEVLSFCTASLGVISAGNPGFVPCA
ncbi:MAG: M24 family metallopeptidase [Chthoniobacterales bacterium]